MKYGPNTAAIETLFNQWESLTPQQADKIFYRWVHCGPNFYTAQLAAQNLLIDLDRVNYLRVVVRDPFWQDNSEGLQGAVYDAARALIVKDRLDKRAFDTLYGPWASVFGRPE